MHRGSDQRFRERVFVGGELESGIGRANEAANVGAGRADLPLDGIGLEVGRLAEGVNLGDGEGRVQIGFEDFAPHGSE